MPKQTYEGKSIFQKQDFRGLLIADYTDAIGNKAYKYTNELEQQFDAEMSKIDCFNRSKEQSRSVLKFYKFESNGNTKASKK